MLYQFGDMNIPETDRSQSSGMVLKSARNAAKLTLEQVAEAADTTPQQIHRLEKDSRKMTIEWAKKLSPIVGVSAMRLLMPGEFTELEEEYFELISSASGDDKKRVIDILRAFLNSDTQKPQ